MSHDLKTFLQDEYAHREERLSGSDLYSVFNPAYLYMVQQRQRQELALLRRHDIDHLKDKRILEVGCGRGGILSSLVSFGARQHLLHGVDLIHDRVVGAQQRFPAMQFTCADGQRLPYAAASFDLVVQYTAFSSILDDHIKAQVAQDMRRVLRPDGLILWYDFWLNPSNPQTRGIRPAEIKRLFPGCRYDFRRVTLAPPLTRKLAARSWMLCLLLEKLRLLNTHYLVIIQKQEPH
ncbi:MAG: class I SAM-dependent methyltransferase [Anaerolineae bacterium]|nr:class I SAM-dependent methyltransferase [Anaerolineae bacterium]